ncbi:MAG TPA: efflux transporter outer membrane subunit, partial [Candidatus Sulfotelmatobacter sp.]|nr:efflux transporter outer membrane subunit [Candidatus Sulfotelmatobacter sp.]
TMAPKYERPPAPVSSAWPSGPAYGTNAAANASATVPAAEIGWREFFSDPRLLKLVELSLTNNRDLRIAALNVEVSRAQYRIQRSLLLPTVNANAGGSRQLVPGDLSRSGGPTATTEYHVSASIISYELDVFGRVRSLKNQALNRYLATDQARRSVQISLVAEVAIQYLSERQLAEQLVIAKQTLEAVTASYELNRRSFENGVISELDLRTAEAQVQTARANVASIIQDRAQAENALVLLVGQPLPADLPAPQPLEAQPVMTEVPAGLPSDLLQRRPDILAAEYQLKAANANIGAARAAFFPRILLTAAAGKTSLSLEDLFAGSQNAWRFAPEITVPIFDAGNNRANLNVAKTSQRIEVANYERAIQSAFREVADALAARTMLEEQIAARELLVKAEQQRYELAQMRYRNGVDSYLNVLSAQQDLYNAQQSLILVRTARLSSVITLYKALGGGWTAHQATGTQALVK